MPSKKSKKSVKVIKKLRSVSEIAASPEFKKISGSKKLPTAFVIKLIAIVGLGVVLYFLALKYRGNFIAGMVNSSPITRWELNQHMAEKYAKQTFDEIVGERLLAEQLKKNGITVSEDEVKTEMDKIIKEYGGEEAFKSALTQYGLSPDKAKESIKQSISLKKLIEKLYPVTISEEQTKKYFDDNKKNYPNQKYEDVKLSIMDNLKQQELYMKTQEWFSTVKKEAKIVTFI